MYKPLFSSSYYMEKGGFAMSGKTCRICLAVAAVAAAVIFIGVFLTVQRSSIPQKEQKGVELVETEPSRPEELDKTVILKAEDRNETAEESYEYVLVDHNNYVAVYQLPERTIYEYTDVIMDVLPEETREEIRKGKYLRNEEELYNFLENYTS